MGATKRNGSGMHSPLNVSLDFELSFQRPNRDKGHRLVGRPREPPVTESGPGPGRYTLRGERAWHGAIFGTAKRPVAEDPVKVDAPIVHLGIYATPSHHAGIRGYTFGKVTKESNAQSLIPSPAPGPGHYKCNVGAVMPRPVSYSLSLTGAIQKIGVVSLDSDVPFHDPQPTLRTLSNFQKFSQLPLKRCSMALHYRRVDKLKSKEKKRGSETTIIERNQKRASESTREAQVRQREVSLQQRQFRRLSVLETKESTDTHCENGRNRRGESCSTSDATGRTEAKKATGARIGQPASNYGCMACTGNMSLLAMDFC